MTHRHFARVQEHQERAYSSLMWLLAACLSALFAGLTSVHAKAGVATTSSTVATALRTLVVATCASWLAYYHALKDGPASVVVPIDKLSILVTVTFSAIVFHERFTGRYLAGLTLMCTGTAAMVVT